MVLCIDEKSQIQVLERAAPILPLRPGLADYCRHGTTTLFAALEVTTGKVLDACYPRHRGEEFLRFPQGRGQGLPATRAARRARQLRRPQAQGRQRVAGAPPAHPPALHAHALELDEPRRGLFSIITRQAIRRGSFRSVRELLGAIRRFIDAWNERCEPFVWTKTAEEILAKANRQTESVTED